MFCADQKATCAPRGGVGCEDGVRRARNSFRFIKKLTRSKKQTKGQLSYSFVTEITPATEPEIPAGPATEQLPRCAGDWRLCRSLQRQEQPCSLPRQARRNHPKALDSQPSPFRLALLPRRRTARNSRARTFAHCRADSGCEIQTPLATGLA